MADDKRDLNETNTRGTDWEVVSLTASTFAAAPGPPEFDPTVLHKKEEFNKTEQECSEAMFMSKHFVVAPHESEKLPAENYSSAVYKEQSIQDDNITEPQKSNKDSSTIDTINDLHGSHLFDMECSLSDHSMNLGYGKQEGDLKMVEKDHALFVSPNEISFDDGANVSLPVIHDDISDLAEPRNPSQEKLDYPSWRAHGCKPNEENIDESFDDSPESWWKKRAISAYNHAKGTNTFWSIFVAVAVAGLVILGQRWRREKSQFQQFKWKFIGTGEKINTIAGPVGQLKFLVGGNHRTGPMRQGLHPTF
ncbi:ATG8-interacting protein 2-like [Dendrobium catenatum]|uniref:ATG8-interacting protein 2-like n=1 Tax=Dendrobium catenatum TaxID=906689 RepID=UPI0009F6C6F3|nr:ATG8-interacting protein 2-like [Dendrobium catenatum]